MNYKKWLLNNTESLKGKTVAVTGTTGGIGKELCGFLSELNANLILLDRNPVLSQALKYELETRNSNISVKCINVNLDDFDSVKNATERLKEEQVDVFIHNAGAYSIPRKTCDTGYDNVFQINFVSPYYIIKELLPKLRERNGKVVAVGSIAHNYSKTDKNDVDFKTRKRASLVYGNAKRFLMFSLIELFKNEDTVNFAVAHPGIAFTKITNHYPKVIFWLIKHPMKVIFMKPKKAALSVLKGLFEDLNGCEWLGPRLFNVWGLPNVKPLKTCDEREIEFIKETADKIYLKLR